MFKQRIIGKFLSLSLILFLLYNSFGFIAVHFFRAIKIKSDVIQSIRNNSFDDDLVMLVFSKKEINGLNPVIDRIDEMEFRYKGDYYDIVRVESERDSVFYYCIYDEEENFLDYMFINHLDRERDNKSSHKLLSRYYLKILADYYIINQIIPPERFQVRGFLISSENFIASYFPEITTPPPNSSTIPEVI